MSSPTVRSLKMLRDAGYLAEVVEKWQPFHGSHPMLVTVEAMLSSWRHAQPSTIAPTDGTPGYITKGLELLYEQLSKSHPLSAGVRKDLFGFGDILAVKPGEFLIVQTTAASGQAARRSKIIALPEAGQWLRAGGRIMVHGWRKKLHKPGGKAMRWFCNETQIMIDQIKSFEEF